MSSLQHTRWQAQILTLPINRRPNLDRSALSYAAAGWAVPLTRPPSQAIPLHELELLHVSSDTIRRWLLARKLPTPDVALTRKTVGWKRSTLERAGIRLA